MRSNNPRCCHVLADVCEDMAVFLLRTNSPVKNTEQRVEGFHNKRRIHLSLTKRWLLHGKCLNFEYVLN